jgi:sodium-dependent dicarboxylate transporter 2/3/5
MERWNLHRRVALAILSKVGAAPHGLMIGCMGITAFLSMWISNTATTLMMFPIALALVSAGLGEDNPARQKFAIALFLGIAYSASAGGIATLVGTPPNIVFAGVASELDTVSIDITFARWVGVGLPVTFVLLPIIYLVLTKLVYRFDSTAFSTDPGYIHDARTALGRMSFAEKAIATIFTTTALLWIFRKNIEIGDFVLPGWSNLFPFGDKLHDSTVAVAMALLTFIIPSGRAKGEFLMDKDWYKYVRLDILFLVGGGFSLAHGFQNSGLSEYLGQQLVILEGLPPALMMIALCLFVTFLTELTSNTATTTVLMPILAATAVAMEESPLMLMIPATVAASCAFMLPVATGPNAIAYASGKITIAQMVRAGLVLNLITAPIIGLMVWWLAPRMFGF